MKTYEQTSHQHHGRALFKTAVLVVGAILTPPVVAAAAVMAVDLVKHRSRKERTSPRPGTFHSRVDESTLSVYTDGAATYDGMIEAIDSAERTILMEAFIWKNDEAGQQFIDALNNAARRKVKIFLIYDGFANLAVPRSFYRQLSSDIHVFRMPFVWRKFGKGPLRYSGLCHSKILVVDDALGFVGGYNIGSVYSQQWRDTHLRIAGSGAWGLRNAIARVWNKEHGPERQIPWTPPEEWDPRIRVAANLPVQLVYPIRHMYLRAIEMSCDHIWISTPYFIPDQQVLHALIDASKRGVDVRLMVPKESNHVLVDWVSRGFYGQLLDAGVSILMYSASMMHTKVATIDGKWSTIGTANIDRLSLSFNYETNAEIIDDGFAAEMERIFHEDSRHCELLTASDWRDRHPLAWVTEAALVPLRPFL